MYATGLTSVEETLQVQKWVTEYPEVAAELAQIEASLDAFAQAHAVAPSSDVKEKLFAKINLDNSPAKEISISKNEPPVKVIGISSYWKYAAAACVVLLIGSAVYNFSLQTKYNALAKKLEQNQQAIAVLQEKNKSTENNLAILKDKNNVAVTLAGLEAAPTSSAKILWKKTTTGEVYIDVSDLPDAPAGKQYQLWAIVDGVPVDAGMISAANAEEKDQLQKMKSFPKAEAFAITLESEVGNTAPKGTMYVMGKV